VLTQTESHGILLLLAADYATLNSLFSFFVM